MYLQLKSPLIKALPVWRWAFPGNGETLSQGYTCLAELQYQSHGAQYEGTKGARSPSCCCPQSARHLTGWALAACWMWAMSQDISIRPGHPVVVTDQDKTETALQPCLSPGKMCTVSRSPNTHHPLSWLMWAMAVLYRVRLWRGVVFPPSRQELRNPS